MKTRSVLGLLVLLVGLISCTTNVTPAATEGPNKPDVKILWAHAGLSEPPGVVSEMMDKHQHLWADTSIREYQIAPDGELDPVWKHFSSNIPTGSRLAAIPGFPHVGNVIRTLSRLIGCGSTSYHPLWPNRLPMAMRYGFLEPGLSNDR